MAIGANPKLAVWALTPGGLRLAQQIQSCWPDVTLRCTLKLAQGTDPVKIRPFEAFSRAVAQDFHAFDGHIFIMAAGIVVRAIAPGLRHKTVDPAVVVVDDRGRHAVSLLAGHIGGANALARQTADLLGATAVITTATDVNAKPAIDLIAVERGLTIENPEAIKAVNMALVTGGRIRLHDPYGWVGDALAPADVVSWTGRELSADDAAPGIYVHDTGTPDVSRNLVLRPASLVVGIGCNRDTPCEEIRDLLQAVCAAAELSLLSLSKIASIDVKRDEVGLLRLGEALQLPIAFFTKPELDQVVQVPNPSDLVAKHVGVKSVCEAAAILGARMGPLVVPKHKTRNVTVAIARHVFMSSASAREA